jgi:hypothetical protein
MDGEPLGRQMLTQRRVGRKDAIAVETTVVDEEEPVLEKVVRWGVDVQRNPVGAVPHVLARAPPPAGEPRWLSSSGSADQRRRKKTMQINLTRENEAGLRLTRYCKQSPSHFSGRN